MGVSDNQGPWKNDDVYQQIILSMDDLSPERQDEILSYIKDRGIDLERVSLNWNTWTGIFVSPPLDSLPWSSEEFKNIWDILDQCPLIYRIDYSDASGSSS